MKKIGFIGGFDKTDLIIYIAKILTELRKKVLVIDTTLLQKSRYIIPAISPTKFYVTNYEFIDIAVGFDNINDLKGYLGEIEIDYDIVLIDVDSNEKFDEFELENAELLYFVTAFDSYSLKKGIEVIGTMRQKVKMKKVLFEKEISEEDNEYLNLLSLTSPIEWNEEIIHFPYELGDLSAIIENQRVTQIKLRNLTEEYREGLYSITREIVPDVKPGDIKRVFKNL